MDRRQFLQAAALTIPAAALAPSILAASPAEAATQTRFFKGFVTGARTDLAVSQMRQLNLDWFYTWGRVPNLGQPVNDFTPMIWSAKSADSVALEEIRRNLWRTRSTSLLGFNEPDLRGQANMSVDQALKLWPLLEKMPLKLGSPATISPHVPWMNEFMTKAIKQRRRIDFVATHIYQYPNAKTFFKKVDDLYSKWGKPIWVTETAVADWDATPNRPMRYSRQQINEYMQEIYAGCLKRKHVTRFAWKTRAADDPVMGNSAFFNLDGSLTSTAKIYARL